MPSFSEIKMVSFIYLEEASFTQHTQQLKLRRLCYCQYFIMNKLLESIEIALPISSKEVSI